MLQKILYFIIRVKNKPRKLDSNDYKKMER